MNNTQPPITSSAVPYQLSFKVVVLAVLVFVSWLATMFVWNIVDERRVWQNDAATTIANQWSAPQLVAGPVLAIPTEETSFTADGTSVTTYDTLYLLPKEVHYDGSIDTEIRTKGIYAVPVYAALINCDGIFDLSQLPSDGRGNTKIRWDQASISLTITDTRGITSAVALTWGDATYPLEPGSTFTALDDGGIHTNLTIDPTTTLQKFSFSLPLHGSSELSFLPLGESTTASVRANWGAPSFLGEFLPTDHTIATDTFTAAWQVASYGKNVPQSWSGNTTTITDDLLREKSFGVGLYQDVNLYTMIDRATKYSILFISLTFLTFFMYEVLAHLRIHPMQYLLVGFAIALFYLLLLSFAEMIGFAKAYAFSTAATTLLITSYCFSVLKAKRRAYVIFGLLTALYGYLYILLQLQALSLLFGSLLLFGVLATVMYLTRNLDWYTLSTPSDNA